jgi:hypothetical protein
MPDHHLLDQPTQDPDRLIADARVGQRLPQRRDLLAVELRQIGVEPDGRRGGGGQDTLQFRLLRFEPLDLRE